jgi:AcrR family transcriptional regulator
VQAKDDNAGRTRRPRADALLNRDGLLSAAKVAFAEVGADVSLEEIARRANVGVATAYRNFPTKDAIIEAVYRAEVEHLAKAAPDLLASMPAAEALHQWMHLSVDYVAAKTGLASALGVMIKDGSDLYSYSIGLLTQATTLLVARAIAEGAIRDDVTAIDLLRAQIGFSPGHTHPTLEVALHSNNEDLVLDADTRQEFVGSFWAVYGCRPYWRMQSAEALDLRNDCGMYRHPGFDR